MTTEKEILTITQEALNKAQAEPARAHFHAAQGLSALATKRRALEAGDGGSSQRGLLRFLQQAEGALVIKQEHPGEGFAENLLDQLERMAA